MKELLFLVALKEFEYGCYNSVVVVSDSIENAHKVAIDFSENFNEYACTVTYIGFAASNFKLGDIICSQYVGD